MEKSNDFLFATSAKLYNDYLMSISYPWSAKEDRLLRRESHIGRAWEETKSYQPFPESRDAVAGTIGAAGNLLGKAAHAVIKFPDALVHDIVDPNGPQALPGGPMQRTRQKIGSILGRVLSGDIFKKPIRTVASIAYETVFELPQNALLDIPETLSGNTNRTRGRLAASFAA